MTAAATRAAAAGRCWCSSRASTAPPAAGSAAAAVAAIALQWIRLALLGARRAAREELRAGAGFIAEKPFLAGRRRLSLSHLLLTESCQVLQHVDIVECQRLKRLLATQVLRVSCGLQRPSLQGRFHPCAIITSHHLHCKILHARMLLPHQPNAPAALHLARHVQAAAGDPSCPSLAAFPPSIFPRHAHHRTARPAF